MRHWHRRPPARPSGWWRAPALLLVVAGGACGQGGAGPEPAGAGRFAAMYRGLCESRAAADRPDRARVPFFDDAHQPIHELAALVAGADRAAAARLLEAKQAVEADLAREATADPAVMADHLDTLLAAARRALVAGGQPAPAPCQEAP